MSVFLISKKNNIWTKNCFVFYNFYYELNRESLIMILNISWDFRFPLDVERFVS